MKYESRCGLHEYPAGRVPRWCSECAQGMEINISRAKALKASRYGGKGTNSAKSKDAREKRRQAGQKSRDLHGNSQVAFGRY